jgi:hypothetical protein
VQLDLAIKKLGRLPHLTPRRVDSSLHFVVESAVHKCGWPISEINNIARVEFYSLDSKVLTVIRERSGR